MQTFLTYVYKLPKTYDECILNVFSKFADEFVDNSNVCVFFSDINCDMLKYDISGKICNIYNDDVIKWKLLPRYWPFVWEFTGHRWIPLTKAQ